MVRDTLGGYGSIQRFVEAKLNLFESMERSYRALCLLMFSEKENVMYESAYGYEIRKTTYGESLRHILERSAKLREKLKDLPADSVVGLYLSNGLDWIELFWAILAAGFSPLLMNQRLNDPVLEDAVASIGCKAVVSEGKAFSVPTYGKELFTAEGPAEEIADPEAALPEHFGSTLYVMSSGTSAHVKVCGYTAAEFFHQIRGSYGIIKKSRGIKKHYKGALKQLLLLPLYHIFGLTAVYTWFAFFSRTFVELPDMAPKTILRTIRQHEVTHIFSVPLFFEKVYDEALREIQNRGEKTAARFEKGMAIEKKLRKRTLLHALFVKAAFREVREQLFGESISYLITGGAMVRPEVLSFFNAIGYHLSNGYGMTEIGITSVELSECPAVLDEGAIGSPMDAVEYRVSDAGELLVRGRVMALSITEDGKTTLNDGEHWFNTHDLAREEDGRFFILGRRDDLVIGNSGENLNPVQLEPALMLPGVEGVCLTAEEKDGVKRPLLIVSLPEGTDAETAEQKRKEMQERLQELHLASEIGHIAMTDAPLLSEEDFKLNRRKIREAYRAGKLPEIGKAVRTEESGDLLTEEIRAFFAKALHKEPSEIPADADFFSELGGSSLDYFGMMGEIRMHYGIDFPFTSGNAFFSVNGVAAFIREGQRK